MGIGESPTNCWMKIANRGIMPELCAECHARPAYAEFTKLALSSDEELRSDFGRDALPPGGLLFLGRHYAHSRTMLLTLNPTPHAPELPQTPIYTDLYTWGLHWDGPAKSRYRNFTGGRHLFQGMIDAAPNFASRLALATDTYMVPWPSKNWASMLLSLSWPAIQERSRALFERTVADHMPDLLFTTGKTANTLLWQFMGIPRPKPVDVWQSPTRRQWDAEHFQLTNVTVGVTTLPVLDVFRLPHFSRFNRKQFYAVGGWVAERLPALPIEP